jgi:hypothetical protein
MDYRVLIVNDHALPTDVKRVMVEKRGRDPLLVLAESAAGNWRFLQEWEQGRQDDEHCLRAV